MVFMKEQRKGGWATGAGTCLGRGSGGGQTGVSLLHRYISAVCLPAAGQASG